LLLPNRKRKDPATKYSEGITANFTPPEYDRIYRAAKERNITLAAFVREAVMFSASLAQYTAVKEG